MGVGKRPDLYSSVDVAIARSIMGEDLRANVGEDDRRRWIKHIYSYAHSDFNDPDATGMFGDRFKHGVYHANGQVTAAMNVLGGPVPFPQRLYAPFDAPEKLGPWLETAVTWTRPWSESHKLWGGVGSYSLSDARSAEWIEALFEWLDSNADPATGWWRRGIEPFDRWQPLGGAAHILPLYLHQGRDFPYPEAIIDSTLALQHDGGWWHPQRQTCEHHYLELDALYVFADMKRLAPDHRTGDIAAAAGRYADYWLDLYRHERDAIFGVHPHWTLSFIGSMGLLSRLLPDRFQGDRRWSDIFMDPAQYRAAHAFAASSFDAEARSR